MEVYNNILCIEARWMINNEIMSESNYKKLSQRKDINVLRPGKGLDHPALVEFDSLPDRFKQKIMQIIPNPYTSIHNNLLKIEHNSAISLFNSSILLPYFISSGYRSNIFLQCSNTSAASSKTV